jgi:hypothetical protein
VPTKRETIVWALWSLRYLAYLQDQLLRGQQVLLQDQQVEAGQVVDAALGRRQQVQVEAGQVVDAGLGRLEGLAEELTQVVAE